MFDSADQACPDPDPDPDPDSGWGAGVVGVRIGGGADPGDSAVARMVDGMLAVLWAGGVADWVDRDWYGATAGRACAELLGLRPGPELVAALTRLGAAQPGSPVPAAAGPVPALGTPAAGSPTRTAWCGGVDHGEPVGPVAGWGCVCGLIVASAWEAVTGWGAARAAAALVAVAGPVPVRIAPAGGAPGVLDPGAEDVAVSLRLSPDSVRNRIGHARDLLAHRALFDLVCSGALSCWTARSVLGETAGLPGDAAGTLVEQVCQQVRSRLAPGARGRAWTAGQVRAAARKARARLPEHVQAPARAAARNSRCVGIRPVGNGMAALYALIPELPAIRIHNRLNAMAHALDDPERTLQHKRADLLTDLLLANPTPPGHADGATRTRTGHVDGGTEDAAGTGNGGRSGGPDAAGCCAPPSCAPGCTPPGRGRGPVEVSVVIDLATLLGLGQEPGHVPGLGHVPAAVARELAADGRWRAWITGTTADAGDRHVIATGSSAYTPSAALARLVRAREPRCRMPGCTRRSTNCDLDHTTPHPTGATTSTNLGPLCRRHHNLKTHHGYDLDTNPHANGDDPADHPADQPPGWTWTTPNGITRHCPPPHPDDP